MKLRLWHKEVNMTWEAWKEGFYCWNTSWKDMNTLDSKEILTLKNQKSQLFYQQNEFTQEKQRIEIWDKQTVVSHR